MKIERNIATAIYQALSMLKEQLQKGDITIVKAQALSDLNKKGFKVDYIEIADAENLYIVNEWDGKQKLVALAAAFMNEVRLIDNILLN